MISVLIHSAVPQLRPVVTIIFTRVIRPFVLLTYQSIPIKSENNIWAVSLAEGIINDALFWIPWTSSRCNSYPDSVGSYATLAVDKSHQKSVFSSNVWFRKFSTTLLTTCLGCIPNQICAAGRSREEQLTSKVHEIFIWRTGCSWIWKINHYKTGRRQWWSVLFQLKKGTDLQHVWI